MVLNFDKIIETEFGRDYCIRESLSFTIQLYPSAKNLIDAVVSNPSVKPAVDFIKNYRSAISTDVLTSGDYAFKAFLIQVANHQSSNALPIQFYPYNKLTAQEKVNVDRIAALVKHKHVPVSNLDMLKPSTVVKRVQISLGNPKVYRRGKQIDKFTMDTHTRCWKRYEVRPDNGEANPANTRSNYCLYDLPNNQYLYTEGWVEFLVEKLSNDDEYNSLYLHSTEEELESIIESVTT